MTRKAKDLYIGSAVMTLAGLFSAYISGEPTHLSSSLVAGAVVLFWIGNSER